MSSIQILYILYIKACREMQTQGSCVDLMFHDNEPFRVEKCSTPLNLSEN